MTDASPEPFLGASEYRIVERGKKFEDFSIGQVFHHHWGRTITESDVVTFATATCHWLPLFLNREYAEAAGHPELVVPAMLALGIVVGLSVEDLSEAGGPFLGLNNCQFEQPVHVGDTVTARSVVTAARLSNTVAGFGIVTWQTTATNQHGNTVLGFSRSNLVATRAVALNATAKEAL